MIRCEQSSLNKYLCWKSNRYIEGLGKVSISHNTVDDGVIGGFYPSISSDKWV